LLKQAIADNPERDDYRVKLAETHYAGKNADAFVEVATDIKPRVDESSSAWKKVLAMGQDLCADNPMFQATIVGSPDVESLSPGSPEMDFDLGMDEKSPGLNEQPLEMSELESDAQALASVDELEFDLSDTGAVEVSPDTADVFSLDIDASELDIDVKAEAEGIDLTDDIEESIDLTDIDIGLDEVTENSKTDVVAEDIIVDVADVDLDVDFGLDDTDADLEAAVAEEADAIDLTEEAESLDLDIDLDLGEDANDEIKVVEAALVASNDFDDEEDFDLSGLDDVDEISTKLDLARAYLDMGDHEGTKDILEEVLADGDDEQKHEASELMAKLG
jgi:pilus assembly protein FimV